MIITISAFIATATIAFVWTALYNVYFHPLRGFPGPIACRATSFYRHFKFLSGKLPFAVKSLHDTYGPVVRISPNELSFVSPQAWKDIYLPQGSAGREDMARYDRFYQFTGPTAPATLVTMNRAHHDQLKRQLAPAFSEKTLRNQEPMMQEYVGLLIRRLAEESKDGKQPVDMRDWFNFYTFDIIGNLGFGSDFSGLQSSKYHPWVRAVTQTVKEFAFLHVLMYLGFQWIVHLLANSSLLRGKVLHEDLTRQKLEARMRQETGRPDMIDPLLRLKEPLTSEQLLANATILIISGSESSSALLVATVSLLTDNRAAMQRVTEEIRTSFRTEADITLASLNTLTYLCACLNEALRCFHPVPPGLPRVTPKGGAVIAGHMVPEDTVVSVASWAAYHSEEHFTDPYGFHPERFLNDPRFAHDRFDALQPFGLGHASCPGRNLAFAETRLALARILYNFDVESAPNSRNWTSQQNVYLLWDKQPFWALLKPIRR